MDGDDAGADGGEQEQGPGHMWSPPPPRPPFRGLHLSISTALSIKRLTEGNGGTLLGYPYL